MKSLFKSSKYDNMERFISYYYQINSIIKTTPKNILEIGVGNKTVSNYLRQLKFKVVTCDIDETLKPNVIADVRKLPFKKKSFDTVYACQVLEHIPFIDLDIALAEMSRVSKKYVIISIPYSSANLEIVLKFSIPLFKEKVHMAIRIPYFFVKINFKDNKEHYWEMGRLGYPKRKIKKVIQKYFKILKEFQPPLNSYHYFLILEVRK